MTDGGAGPPPEGPPPYQPDGVINGAPPRKGGMGTPVKIGIGCGAVLLLLIIGGCAAVVLGFNSVKDDVENSNVRLTDQTVSLDQFNRVQNGQGLQEVEDILGGPGVKSGSGMDGTSSETYTWSGSGFTDVAAVTFRDGQVVSKYQLGLE